MWGGHLPPMSPIPAYGYVNYVIISSVLLIDQPIYEIYLLGLSYYVFFLIIRVTNESTCTLFYAAYYYKSRKKI